jgi:hypothetical protein
MKKFVHALAGLMIFGSGCDYDQIQFDDINVPRINSLVAVPIGELTYTAIEVMQEVSDSSTVFDIDEDSLLSLIYTDQFSYIAGDDVVSVGDISNNATIALPTAPSSNEIQTIPFSEIFTFLYPATDGELLDSLVYSEGIMTFTVTSVLNPIIDYTATIINTIGPNGQAVTFNGQVANSSQTQTQDLSNHSTFLTTQGIENTFQVRFDGNINLAPGQSILLGDQLSFELSYTNQQFSILFGDFGQDTLQVGNQILEVDFFRTLGGEDAIEFRNPQINISIDHNIGVPLGISFSDVTASRADMSADPVALSGTGVRNPQLLNTPTTSQIGETLNTLVGIDGTNSNLGTLFGSAPDQINLDLKAILNPPGSDQRNFFVPGDSELNGTVEVKLPLQIKMDELQRDFEVELGNIEFDDADSISIRIVSLNLLPFSIDMDFQILDENDSVLYEVNDIEALAPPFLNSIDQRAYQAQANIQEIPLSPEGIEALNNGTKINLASRLNSPKSLTSRQIFPGIYADYDLTIKVSALAKLNVEFPE